MSRRRSRLETSRIPRWAIQAGAADQMLLQQARIRGAAFINIVRPEPIPDGITEIRVAAGKVILGTSSGRIVAVGAADGRLLWQIRPSAGAIARISCSDDFTAAKGDRDRAGRCCSASTTTAGGLVHMRSFPRDPLQNILVTNDGQLIYTTLGTMASRDLYDQGERSIFEVTPENRQNNTTFLAQDRFDQFAAGGRCDRRHDPIVAPGCGFTRGIAASSWRPAERSRN